MSRKRFGEVPEPVEVMWHHRGLVKTSVWLTNKIEKLDAVDANLKSFAHIAVAAKLGCSWCIDFSYFKAHNQSLDLSKASQVPRWRESEVFTPLERDVLEYAEAMTATPPTVTDELAKRLLGRLGPAAMVELTSYIAFANFGGRTNVALGIESQGYSSVCEIPAAARPEKVAASALSS